MSTATNTLSSFMSYVHNMNEAAHCQSLTDGQLLEMYLSARDEDAFAAIVQRHGSMVFGLCRRLLHHEQEAEDAFQATFIVLATKASSVNYRENISSWLHRVALRCALAAQSTRHQHKPLDTLDERLKDTPPWDDAEWREVKALFDQELNCLSEQYRTVLVLCDLEGRSQQEVAEQLGCSKGTLSSRLSRGRKLLATRLSRKGLGVTLSTLVAFSSSGDACARLSYPLLSTTVCGAIRFAARSGAVAGLLSSHSLSLARGVLSMMIQNVLKKVSAVVFLASLIGTGLLAGHHALTTTPAPLEAANPTVQKPRVEPVQQAPKQPASLSQPEAELILFELKAVDANRISDLSVKHLVEAVKSAKSVDDLKKLRQIAGDVEKAQKRNTSINQKLLKLRYPTVHKWIQPVSPLLKPKRD